MTTRAAPTRATVSASEPVDELAAAGTGGDPAVASITGTVDSFFLPSGPGASTWAAFLESHAFVMRRLAAELEAEEGLSLADFDALIQLGIAPDGRRRMSELADAVLLSRSGVSRMVDRLAAAGLMERRMCPSDARGAEAALTPAGMDRLQRAAEVHFRGVARHFTDVISAGDREAVTRALRAVAEHNRGVGVSDREHCA